MGLVDDLLAVCPTARPLDEPAALRLLDLWAAAFGIDTRQVWWWATDFEVSQTSSYAAECWQAALAEHLARLPGRNAYLVLTDDEPSPWRVCTLPVAEFLPALAELPCVEFFLVPEDHSLILFDTHHDTHVVVRRRGEGEALNSR